MTYLTKENLQVLCHGQNHENSNKGHKYQKWVRAKILLRKSSYSVQNRKEKYEGHKAIVQDASPTCNKQQREGKVNTTQMRPITAETDNYSGRKTAAKTGSVK